MRKKLLDNIVSMKPSISVLIDESTSLSQKTCMIVYIRCSFDLTTQPTTFFLDLIELEDTTAEGITTALLDCLDKHGLTDIILNECWLGFASDGASVMLGQKAGVYVKLAEKYPSLIGWHCLNHRLELSIHDAVKSCTQVNHFKIFMDRLYSLYSMSPKNRRRLEQCASEIGTEVNKIGKILDVRWVASSFRAVKAVWNSYAVLHSNSSQSAADTTIGSKSRA